MNMICIKDYKGIGFLKNNHDRTGTVNIKIGNIIECDEQGYLWFKNVCFGHKDAELGKYFKLAEEI